MRISDWSSDVCSSDLPGARELPIIRAGKLAFNVAARTARSGDHVIELTRREADLLELLIRRAGAVVRRSTIEDALYRFDEPVTPNAVEAIVSRLRHKRSEEHTSELQSLMRISYAVFCLKKKTHKKHHT